MTVKIENGDYVLNERGCMVEITAIDDIIRRALICLSVKKGAFKSQPSFGNDLSSLNVGYANDESLKMYISEALAPIDDIEVLEVKRNNDKRDNAVSLSIQLQILDEIASFKYNIPQ